jgi:hypothetical protein
MLHDRSRLALACALLAGCWTAREPTAPPVTPRRVHHAFKKTPPTELDEASAMYEAHLGDDAVSLAKREHDPVRFRGRLEYARWRYDRVPQFYPQTRAVERARFGLAEVMWLEGDATAALDELADIATHGRDPWIRQQAGDFVVAVYADVADARLARAFFMALDASRAELRLQLLADRYRNNGKSADASVVDSQRKP